MLEISPFSKRGTFLPFGWHPMCILQSLADEAGLLLFSHLAAKRKLLSVAGPGLRGHTAIEAAKGKSLKKCSIQQQTGSE